MTVDGPLYCPVIERRDIGSGRECPPPHGMVVVPGLAMSNRPRLHIPNGYTQYDTTSRLETRYGYTNGTVSPNKSYYPHRVHPDPWSPSAVKLNFLIGNDPNPDPRGTCSYISQSVSDLRGERTEDRGVPLWVSDPRGGDRGTSLSDGEEEYVTLDYSYNPRASSTRSSNPSTPRGSNPSTPRGSNPSTPRSQGLPSPRSYPTLPSTHRHSYNPGYVSRDSFPHPRDSLPHPRDPFPHPRSSSMVSQPRRPPLARHISVENGSNVDTLQRKKTNTLRKVAETIGLARPAKEEDSEGGEEDKMKRKRSKSLSDLTEGKENVSCYSDDEDGDDFGFRNSPYSPPASNVSPSTSTAPPAMLKVKSPNPGRRKILPKRWRSKTKAIPSVTASSLWSPEGSCTWWSVSGRKVVLKPVSLLQLTDPERLALQKISLPKLQAMDLGCTVNLPKDSDDNRRSKKLLSMKRRSKSANLGGLLDALAEKEKQKDTNSKDGLVFNIPLSKCISNDKESLKKQNSKCASSLKTRTGSADNLLSPRHPRKSSSSSQSSMENTPHNGSVLSSSPSHKRHGSSDSLSESESSRNTSSSLIDALSLSLNQSNPPQPELRGDNPGCYATGAPQVPQIVNACFKHIETYGLQVLGIFRVGSSKKRVKQLREEFDCGKHVTLNDTHNPHDVGALLKEYFRDLPEPLLTRELYNPFLASRKIKDAEKRMSAMRLLVSLLPVPNRDTFWALLKFLAKVVQHSTDTIDQHGQELPGNKMDSHNLATLFGPNILHKSKSSDKEFRVETTEHAEQSREIIEIVKEMIDSYHTLYEVAPDLHDDVIRLLMETNPEVADKILKQLAHDVVIEPDMDTSSSVFDDSDSPSLPHSPCSDADLLTHSRGYMTHQTLRTSKSADPFTPTTPRKPMIVIEDERRTANTSDERVRVRVNVEKTPSPVMGRRSQRSAVKVTRDSSSPEVSLRPHDVRTDRPYSEGYCHSLSIPKPGYIRENSNSSVSSYLSSTNSPAGSENSIQWGNQSPPSSRASSPRPMQRSSSTRRPLNLNQSEDAPVGSAEWQRERWRHWELIAADKRGDGYEQETLV